MRGARWCEVLVSSAVLRVAGGEASPHHHYGERADDERQEVLAVILHPVDQRAGPPLYISSAYGLTKAMKTAAAPVQTNVCVTFSPTQPVRRGSAARLAPSYIKVLERDNTPRTFDNTKTKVCRDVSFGFDARGHGAVHISQPPAPLYNSALDPHNTRATGDSCACASRSARQRMLSP